MLLPKTSSSTEFSFCPQRKCSLGFPEAFFKRCKSLSPFFLLSILVSLFVTIPQKGTTAAPLIISPSSSLRTCLGFLCWTTSLGLNPFCAQTCLIVLNSSSRCLMSVVGTTAGSMQNWAEKGPVPPPHPYSGPNGSKPGRDWFKSREGGRVL